MLTGFRYIVGQHGNSYGTRFSHDYSVEYVTCDKFLTWGQNSMKEISVEILSWIKKLNLILKVD